MKTDPRENLDYAIYDAPEGPDYVQGYAVQLFCTFSQKRMIDIGNVVQDKVSNPYGFIVTKYSVKESIPCRIVYVIYKTRLEFELGLRKIRNRNGKKINYKFVIPPVNPVWFHKGWVLDTYDPTLYDTDDKKYAAIRQRNDISAIFKEERRTWYKAWIKLNYKCYTPISDTEEKCANSSKSSHTNCRRCPLSHYADRYVDGKCIKYKDENRKGIPKGLPQ